MAESAGTLSFGFDADISGFTRAAESAGQTLDRLARTAARWGSSTSGSLSGMLDGAASLQSAQSNALDRAARVMAARTKTIGAVTASRGLSTAEVLGGTTIEDTSGDRDDNSARVMTRLSEQLALLKTTGTAHADIIERMKIEAEQAKLGADATVAEKDAVADLVRQIDAASAAQLKLKAAQAATNQAWNFGSQQILGGIEAMILDGTRLGDVTAGVLRGVAQAGLGAALTGSGPLSSLFGTQGTGGAEGGLFGAIGKVVTGGTSSFAGLFAGGGAIGAGQWGVVGEKGAEIVAGPAAVVPVGKMPPSSGVRGTQVINFNVTSPDAPSFARSESQMAALVSRAVARGQRNM